IATLGADAGYCVSVLRVVAADPASAPLRRAADPLRLAAAVRQAGGVTAEALWQFPLPPHLNYADKQSLLEYWNRSHAGRADREMLRQLVLALRIWRPDIVVTGKKGDAALSSMVCEALEEAVKQAADAKTFPEQIEALGLSAWQVKKLYATAE